MKLTILALLAAGAVAPCALADNTNGPLALAVTPNGHGQSHFQYYQTNASQAQGSGMSVALVTDNGGVGATNLTGRDRPLADSGMTRFVVGNNQHGTPQAAYIPQSSQFGPATVGSTAQ